MAAWFSISQLNVKTKPITTKTEMLLAYTGWVYAAVTTLSADVRANPWALWRRSGKGPDDWEMLDDSKVPPILLRPNATQSWGDFIELTQIHLDMTGEAYWHIITAGQGGGKPIGMQILYPHWIQEPIFNDAGTQLLGWRVQVPGRSPVTIPAVDVVFLKYPHPMEPFCGASPVEAFALSYSLDLHARAYGAALMENKATPEGILTVEQELTVEQADAIRARWRERYTKPGEIAVLGKGAKYIPVGINMKDLEFLNLAKMTQDQILAIYKVPASKLGLVTDVNRANADANDNTYKENAVLPRLLRLQEAVNLFVLPRLLADRTIYFEFDSPVDEDESFNLEKSSKLFQSGSITMDEYRAAQDMDPLEGDQGNVYFVPAGVTLVKDLAEVVEAGRIARQKANAPAEQGADEAAVGDDGGEGVKKPKPPSPADDAEESPATKIMERVAMMLARKRVTQLKKKLAENAFLRAQGDEESAYKSGLRSLFSREQKAMVAAYKDQASEQRAGVAVLRDWTDDILRRFKPDFETVMSTQSFKALEAGWLLLAEEINQTLDFTLFEPSAHIWAETQSGRKIVGIQDFTRESVRGVVATGVEEGLSVDKIADSIRALYDDFKGVRAETIARTETAAAVSYGKESHAKEIEQRLGMSIVKTWVATADDRTRQTHVDADGQTVPRNQPFKVGSAYLQQPADPSGPAEEVIRCRCTVAYDTVDEEN